MDASQKELHALLTTKKALDEKAFNQTMHDVMDNIDNTDWVEADVSDGKMFFDGKNRTVGFHGPLYWAHIKRVGPKWVIESATSHGHTHHSTDTLHKHSPPVFNGKTALETFHSMVNSA